MADERVVLDIDLRERRDPVSRAFDRPGELSAAEAATRRDERRRRLGGFFRRRPITPELVPAQSTDVFADRQRLRRAGVFLGEGIGRVEQQRQEQQATEGRGRGPRRPRGGGIGRDPLQLGQIFGTGPIGQRFGLRAAGLATLGTAGVSVLLFDQAIKQAIEAVKTLNRLYQTQVRLLTDFSGPLTAARAERDIATTLQRFQLAQRFGPNLAQTFRQETEFQLVMMRLAAEITDNLQPLLRAVLSIGTAIGKTVEDIGPMRTAVQAIGTALEPLIPGITVALQLWVNRMESEESQEFKDDFFEDQLNFFARPTETFRGERRAQGVREQ